VILDLIVIRQSVVKREAVAEAGAAACLDEQAEPRVGLAFAATKLLDLGHCGIGHAHELLDGGRRRALRERLRCRLGHRHGIGSLLSPLLVRRMMTEFASESIAATLASPAMVRSAIASGHHPARPSVHSRVNPA